VFVSAMLHVSFLLSPLLLILTSQGTGKEHFLIEVEDSETESTNADNGAVGSEEEVDGDGRQADQKGEVKSDAASIKSVGADYGESPVGEIPDLGDDFKSAYVPVDADVPIVIQDKDWNCPCMAKCKIKDTKCAKDCAKTCEKARDYALNGQKVPKMNRKRTMLNKKLPEFNKKLHKLNRKLPKLDKKVKVDAASNSSGADYGEIPILGDDFKSFQIPVYGDEPINANEENFKTGMNCPCLAKCDKMTEKKKKNQCEIDCDKECQSV